MTCGSLKVAVGSIIGSYGIHITACGLSNKEIAKEVGKGMGKDCCKSHVGCLLGPAMNIHKHPLCGRNFEYFSEDPRLSGEISGEVINGIQSTGTSACVKHFCCNNQEIQRYTENTFDENAVSTSGASYSQKFIEVDGKGVILDLWDTAGQEKYRSLGRHFYKDAYIVCLVYDITILQTFNDIKEKWYKDLKTYGEQFTVLALVGNKSDCYEKEEVSLDTLVEDGRYTEANMDKN